jgi:hypothetical protein
VKRNAGNGARIAMAGALALALTVAACGERTGLTSVIVGPGRSGGSVTGTIDSRLIGRWSTVVLFQGSDGSIHASRTTWTFGSDASASRAVIASNLTFGLVDSVVTRARWRSEGSAVVITYLPEGTGSARFDYFLQDMRLILGGIAFDRL